MKPHGRLWKWLTVVIHESRPFGPMLLFVAFPTLLFGLLRLFPWLFSLVLGLGILLAILFVGYTLKYRRENTPLVGASLPTVFGPVLAFTFIVRFDSPLSQTLLKGGTDLVQLAFFFASLAGLAASIYAKLSQHSGQGKETALNLLTFSVFLLLGFLLFFYNKNFAPMHEFPNNSGILDLIKPPDLSPLTVSRLILTLYALAVSTWPQR
jgi:hypothetical protein